MQAPFLVEGIEIYVSASVGISLYPTDASDSETLLKHADVAMYTVKQSGRDGHSLYVLGTDTSLEEISKASRLRKTLDRGNGLVLHYQPLVNLESGEFVGAEALIRWQDGDRGLIPPDDFIPLAERIGLIGSISDWVIGEACRQASAWRDQGVNLYVSINLPPSYCQPTGMNYLLSSARAAGVELDRLVIEVTESALIPDAQQTMEPTLAEMRKRGLKLAIDDFGTGYSSLGRLNQSWVSSSRSIAPSFTACPTTRTPAHSSRRSSSSPRGSGSSRSPKESKPNSNASSSSSTAAESAKVSSSAAPYPSQRWKSSTPRTTRPRARAPDNECRSADRCSYAAARRDRRSSRGPAAAKLTRPGCKCRSEAGEAGHRGSSAELERERRLLEERDERAQEVRTLRAVDRAMVARQRQLEHRRDVDLAVDHDR